MITLIGLAGTCTTLSSLNQRLPQWDPKKIEGSRLKLEEIQIMAHELARRTLEERQKMPGILADRADTLLAGALILEALLQKMGLSTMTVSVRGIRYGLLLEHLG